MKERNLGPKLYTYFSINENGEWGVVNKCKGIPGKDSFTEEILLDTEMYYNDNIINKEKQFHSLQKIHKKISSKDKDKFDHFSIKSKTISRTFNKNTWDGMKLVGNKWYPHSYTGEYV